MEKNELTVVEETMNHVITGAFEGETLQLRNDIYYLGEVPVTDEYYERIEIADNKTKRKQKELKKKDIGKKAVGTIVLPPMFPFLLKDLDAFLKAGTFVNIVWKTGENSIVYIDLPTNKKLLTQENVVIGVVKDILKALVRNTRTPIMLQDVLARTDLPSILKIVDDALYKNDAELKGAAGWCEIVHNQTVLYLFDEVVKDSGLTLKPNMECDTVYYVHPHDRNTYLMVDSMFQIAYEERLAELKQIAYDLGAVQYSVEITAEERDQKHVEAKKVNKAKFKVVDAENEIEMKGDDLQRKRVEMHSDTIYAGGREPHLPKLVWFASNNDIQNLVNNRLNDENRTSFEENVRIKGSSCALMSISAAGKIGATVKKIGATNTFNFKNSVEKENHQILQYRIVF